MRALGRMRGSTFSRRGAPPRRAGLPGRGTAFFPKESGGKERPGGFARPGPPSTGVHGGGGLYKQGRGQACFAARFPGGLVTGAAAPWAARIGVAPQALEVVALYQVRPPGRRRCRRNTGAVTAAIRRGDLWSPAPSRGGVTASAQAADRSLCRKRQSSFPPRRRPSEAGHLSGGRHVWRPYGLGQRISAPGGYPADGGSAGKPEVGAATLGGPFRPERSRAAVGTGGRPLVFCTYLWYTLTK